ncbi:MAG: RnfABCDGE type electron transport complex subunit B, partial [Oscillospiraceae bacterium]|nr:RnfABCDGE type electron transport complex subunit B [Oscillospiraceae bacterium]
MSAVISAVVLVSVIGLAAGILLAVASKVFDVPVDEKLQSITEALPGANCGACGYAGCADYAAALASGEAKNGLCSPGGADSAAAIAEILGQELGEVAYKTALVHCLGTWDNTSNKMDYAGIQTCAAAMQQFAGVGSCTYGCMGLGDCMRACEYGAITVCNGVASINPALCKGCSKCVATCPKHIISFVPLKKSAVIRCMNCDKGGETRKVCLYGCIGCKRCEKV